MTQMSNSSEIFHAKDGSHVPVLLKEVIQALEIQDGNIFVDGTYGRGGYSQAILEAKAGTQVWGLDRDPEAIAHGKEMQHAYPGRFTILQGCFGAMEAVLSDHHVTSVDGIVLDVEIGRAHV